MEHVLSVDVEDYFQVEAFARVVSRMTWEAWPSRVVANTERVLELFARHNARATFFCLGWIADKFPQLLRDVVAAGHELACHSYWHRPVYNLNPEQFRKDTRNAKNAIEDAAGVRVIGYRAPTWSITRNCLWALDILAEEGFVYDSSIFPIHHDLYGIPGAQRFRYVHTCSNGMQLQEFPPTTLNLFGAIMPAAGGGYLRVFPLNYNHLAFRQAFQNSQPAVVYFHPWEVDVDQPRIKAGWKSRFRHYCNLSKMESRVAKLLETYRFQRFIDLLGEAGDCSTPPCAAEKAIG
jgi:polysaccharide deacetylase family protein (PEP-CTERM system associated)